MNNRFRVIILVLFAVLSLLSIRAAFDIRFSFDFEQFFPIGDPDLDAFKEFVKEFETDDNFLLIAIHRPQGVFERNFLRKFHQLTLDCRDLPHVQQVQSLTKIGYPVKTPFGLTTVPAIHVDQPDLYASDRARLLQDERFVRNLISKDGKTLVIFLKTIESIELKQARELMAGVEALVGKYKFSNVHYLGRPYFQQEMVRLQQREIVVATIVSAILVSLVMYLVFRRFWGTVVAVVSLALGLLLFVGFLGGFVRELNTLSALYPVLVLIIGTSDIVHIMSKYNDELHKGQERRTAMWNTIRDVGLATFMTALTTAIGFASLVTNRVMPIKDFGINAAAGVMIAYFTVILFTTVMLTWFRADQIAQPEKEHAFWARLLQGIVDFTRRRPRAIVLTTLVLVLISLFGISRITTNYDIISNLPRNSKITSDFLFFEKNLAGFRPMELAIYTQGDYRANDFEVLQEMEKIEQQLHRVDFIQAIFSSTALYKSINQMYHNNRPDAYRLPETKEEFEAYRRLAKRMPQLSAQVMVSKDERKARITSRLGDIGADRIKEYGQQLDRWIAQNIDPKVIQVKRTGTGLIMDKNAAYVRSNLLLGLGSSIGLISLIIALVLRSVRMMIIFLVPNLVPLLVAGALLGYWGVELDAGISIVFSVVFGIAVDDTIHFLSKFKLERNRGQSVENALRITLLETGKALILTTVFLFFGFLVLLFSQHPTSVVIGLLTSITLFAGMVTELMLAPVLVRWLIRDKN
ncbi:efflux RND transporter permease subunit [Haliscomenobacter hydrossis]|uniref:Patched family protein n=1 Tax=Haliscomenobacter hydrossis (strain ATCC 27775 / DSM 1100 / LMG 10767 / O) TaxID=760192 RepID=F4KPK6_HALH1|nr:MMPL family transporter [Haliscomenobacter hydrossis]AEE50944.1 Patched family protein [Haliscomenobacter hydrossis DSM 1100]